MLERAFLKTRKDAGDFKIIKTKLTCRNAPLIQICPSLNRHYLL